MTDKYWADEETDTFVEELKKRVKDYFVDLRGQSSYLWMKKAWKLYNNIPGKFKGRDKGIQLAGDQGEYAVVGVNNFRNLLKQLIILICGNSPSFKCTPSNNDSRSIDQSRLGEDLINYYVAEKEVEELWQQVAELAIVLGEGYMKQTWDPGAGDQYDTEEVETEEEVAEGEEPNTTSRPIYEGDLKFEVVTPFDIVYDRQVKNWSQLRWCAVKVYMNRWDLMARYPDAKDEILSIKEDDECMLIKKDFESLLESYTPTLSDSDNDLIPVWEFYHARCDAIPEGRFCLIVGSEALVDMALPYVDLPIKRMTAGKTLLTGWGYSPSFDLIALQEVLNCGFSTIVTELRSAAVSNWWVPKGDKVSTTSLPGGGRVIETNNPPQKIAGVGPDIQQYYEVVGVVNKFMELLSGVNSITRGSVDAKLSGTAYALLDSKSIQFASDIQRSYYKLLEDTATLAIRILRDFATTKRVITIVGQDKRGIAEVSFEGPDLANFTRFRVQSQNPIFKTTGGKMEIADKLLQNKLINIPQEYLNLIETGQLDPIYESEISEITAIRRENEALLRGEVVQATRYDNHPLHIKEHKILLHNPIVRANPELIQFVCAHILHHNDVWTFVSMNEPNILMTLGIPPAIPPQGGPLPEQPGEVPQQPMGGQGAQQVMERPIAQRPDVPVRPVRLPESPVPPITEGV